MTRNWGQPLERSQYSPHSNILQETDSVKNHVSLEANISPIERSNEASALADTLTTALGKTLQQRVQVNQVKIPDTQKL